MAARCRSGTQRARERASGTLDSPAVVASDESAAHQVIDEELMETIRDAGCWCRAVYDGGKIEVRLDADRLAGTHILTGIEIVLLLARAKVQTSAHR